LDPDFLDRLASLAHRAIARLIEFHVDVNERPIWYIANLRIGPLEVHEAPDGNDLGAGFLDQTHHLAYDLACADQVIHDDAFQAARVEVLPEIVTARVLLGPKDLVCVQRFSNPESHWYSACGGGDNRAIGEGRQHLGYHTQEP